MDKIFGFKDSDFELLENVPHTKQEVRAIIAHRLGLKEDSILWDIGAGTGTVAVECANLIRNGFVYAIERDKTAYELLVRNIKKFNISNIFPVYGEAPSVFEDLKKTKLPTHVFIGGSGKKTREILEYFKFKGQSVEKIVLTAVTFETLTEVLTVINEKNFQEIFEYEVIEVSIAKTKRLSSYSLLMANNPVFLFDISKKSKSLE